MTSPIDDLKERLEVLSDVERSLVVGVIAKDAIRLAEAYREIAILHGHTAKECPCFYGKKCLIEPYVDRILAEKILKTSREG